MLCSMNIPPLSLRPSVYVYMYRERENPVHVLESHIEIFTKLDRKRSRSGIVVNYNYDRFLFQRTNERTKIVHHEIRVRRVLDFEKIVNECNE